MTRTATDQPRPAASPSMQDVADRAGVAIGTVSNVLNRPERVRNATRLRVETAIAELGFVRNRAARDLAVGSSQLVGLVVVDIGNSFFVDIARGVEAATEQAGLHLLLANSDVDQNRQDRFLQIFDEARAAGLILAPLDAPLSAAHLVRSHGRPVVLVNVPAPDDQLCNVTVDDHLGGRLAAQHLLDTGCRRLAFLGGPLSLRAVANRLAGVTQVVRDAGLSLRVVETHSLTAAPGRAAADDLLAERDPVDGIICSSDLLAAGALGAAVERGVRVPDELAVIGYDDNHFAADSMIPLSTIGQPGHAMGSAATELLVEELTDSFHRHRSVQLQPHLVVRRSTRSRG